MRASRAWSSLDSSLRPKAPASLPALTFRRLPKELQAAIVKAGKEAGAFGRKLESSEDQARLERMEKEGKLKTYVFKDRDQLLKLAEPVKKDYTKEVGAEDVLARINAIK